MGRKDKPTVVCIYSCQRKAELTDPQDIDLETRVINPQVQESIAKATIGFAKIKIGEDE